MEPNAQQPTQQVNPNSQQPAAPAEQQPGVAAPAQTAVQPIGNNSAIKILIVEDEVAARTMFVDLLSSEGYDVSSAVDGVDALAKAAADKFTMILLDIVMPNKDGIETLQEIRGNPDKYGNPIVVMLTNISGDAAVEKAMEIGAAGYRLKVDTEPEQLLEDIQAFMAGKVQNVEEEPVSRSLT
jgi:CheY-like chemotaxis protein